jgi:hypothetical protein
MQKVCAFPKKPKKLKIWYTTAGHRLAVIAWLMLVKTLLFCLCFFGKHMVFAKVFRRYCQHFVFVGENTILFLDSQGPNGRLRSAMRRLCRG